MISSPARLGEGTDTLCIGDLIKLVTTCHALGPVLPRRNYQPPTYLNNTAAVNLPCVKCFFFWNFVLCTNIMNRKRYRNSDYKIFMCKSTDVKGKCRPRGINTMPLRLGIRHKDRGQS